MQIATLNYHYDSNENLNTNDVRGRQRHRHVLTSIVQSNKKAKPRPSLLSDPSLSSSVPLPPIPSNQKRPSSIRIKGSSLTAGKSAELTSYVGNPQRSRSRSRTSEQSDTAGSVRSRSVSPGAAAIRPSSRFVRLKFGHPVKLRSAEFYHSEMNEAEIRAREASFVNDSIRSAHQSRRQSIIPPYEAMSDPHLRRFFQSPIVLDVVRKNMNLEQNVSYKLDERSSNASKEKRRSKTQDPNDYRRIVTKGSSGYGRLNGYDCIPLSSPARQHLTSNRNSALDGSTSNLAHSMSTELHHRRSTTRDKTQASADTSVNSFPTRSSHQVDAYEKKKTMRKYDRFKPPKPIATSSPLRHPLRQLTEETSSTVPQSSKPVEKEEKQEVEVNHHEAVDAQSAQD